MAKNIAIILAGGKGSRFQSDIPKQFLILAGKTVLEHTLHTFQYNEYIDEIAVISNKDYIHVVEEIVRKNDFTKVTKILNGGKERYESTLVALNAFSEEANLLIHDAVRPLVDDRIIHDVVKALKEYEAVNTVIPATDTMLEVDESRHFIQNIPDRNFLYRSQTPQAFKTHVLKKAYEKALQDPNFTTTDDCGVVKKYLPEIKIKIVEGSNRNIKLTYQEDFWLLEKLLQVKN
ncbi:2-C-methyl-D-erythritol 4-phosphate cytidylyltransferase [Odoribacter lunatus]|uniref:2-C-methyl-D-erythritol 4-phosphate cytidylyltransferase n=1 Tax=Odoribacter lunatus TaxID=2941335 RepID=UPI0020405FF1|nr:2-C-methyl-D-erythritol 4-phosphate cytidylyltransferase [Odoribacter lunatus]